MVDVRWILKAEGMRYDVYSPAKEIKAHILLPKDKKCTEVLVNSQKVSFENSKVANSEYVDFEVKATDRKVSVEILF